MESFLILAKGPHLELPIPAPFIGLGAFILLTVLLLITLAIGKGRPHS